MLAYFLTLQVLLLIGVSAFNSDTVEGDLLKAALERRLQQGNGQAQDQSNQSQGDQSQGNGQAQGEQTSQGGNKEGSGDSGPVDPCAQSAKQGEARYTEQYCHPFHVELCVGVATKFRIHENTKDEAYTVHGTDNTIWNDPCHNQYFGSQTGEGPQDQPFTSIALGDLNQDGFLDALVGVKNGSVLFYRGAAHQALELDTSGAFALNVNSADKSFAKPAIDDWNEDGILDVAIGTMDGKIQFFKVETDGVDGTLVDLSGTSSDPFDGIDVGDNAAPTFGDVDNDGIDDVLIGNKNGQVQFFKGQADGSLKHMTGRDYDPLHGMSFGTYASPALGDIDGDGILDVVVGSSNDVLIFERGLDSGGFRKQDTTTATNNPFQGVSISQAGYLSPAIGDLDSDGLPDIVVTSMDVGTVLLKGERDMHFQSWTGAYVNPIMYANLTSETPLVTTAYSVPVIADLNGDGIQDVTVTSVQFLPDNAGFSTDVMFLAGKIREVETWGREVRALDREIGSTNPFRGISAANLSNISANIALTDIDGDGMLDVVVATMEGDFMYYRGDSSGSFTKVDGQLIEDLESIGKFPTMAVGDLDGDGINDALISSSCDARDSFEQSGPGGSPRLLAGDGGRGGGEGGANYYYSGEEQQKVVNYFEVMKTMTMHHTQGDCFWYLKGLSNGTFRIVQNGVEELFGEEASKIMSSSWRSPAIGDINNDGLNDILIGQRHEADGQTEIVVAFFVASNTSTGRKFVRQKSDLMPATGDFLSISVGDVNGDGAPDLVLGDANGGLYFYTLGAMCQNSCERRGRCSIDRGKCDCLQGYAGHDCEQCDEGYYEGESDFGGAFECWGCPGTKEGQTCAVRGKCDDMLTARNNGKWLAYGTGVCTCNNSMFTGPNCQGGSCAAGWYNVYDDHNHQQTCKKCAVDKEKPEAGDGDLCEACAPGYTTWGAIGQTGCQASWYIPLIACFFAVIIVFLLLKKLIKIHRWWFEKMRREASHSTAIATCETLRVALAEQQVAEKFPPFFETPINLWLAKPLNASLVDYVKMLIMNSKNEHSTAPWKKGKHGWTEVEVSMVKKLIHAGQNYIERYLVLSEIWDDDIMLKISDSGVAAKYEETYDSVHSLIREDPSYSDLADAVKECEARKTQYNDEIDRIEDVGDRVVTLYEKASKVRYGHFDQLMTKAGKEAGVQVNIAPLKGLFRVLEKVVFRPDAGVPWDIIRGQLVCKNMKQMCRVLKILAADEHVKFLGVNNRFARPARGWADVGLYLIIDIAGIDCVVCEVQVVHENMMLVREQMGAHDSYDSSRLAAELLKMRKKKRDKNGSAPKAPTVQTTVVLPVTSMEEAPLPGQLSTPRDHSDVATKDQSLTKIAPQ